MLDVECWSFFYPPCPFLATQISSNLVASPVFVKFSR